MHWKCMRASYFFLSRDQLVGVQIIMHTTCSRFLLVVGAGEENALF